jgi:hypothetical protein
MSSPEERQSELVELFKLTDKFMDKDKVREKARLVAIFKNEVALSKRFASLGDSDMAWFHRRLAESIATYLDLWK